MKKIFILFILTATFAPYSFAKSEEINLDPFNDRVPKCCERTKDEITECRFSIFTCEPGEPAEGTGYTQKDGYCVSSSGDTQEQTNKFIKGACDDSQISNSQINENVNQVAIYAGYDQNQKNPNAIPLFVGKIINIALGFTGLIFLIFSVYSAIQWMTAGGKADRVSKARSRLIQSAIGMAITSVAYLAASLIINIIASAS